MKIASVVLLAFASGAASAEIRLPEGYEPILKCAPFEGAPELQIARKDDDYYVAAEVGRTTELHALKGTDGDCGYNNYAPRARSKLGALKDYVHYVTISHDGEDREDESEALIVGGVITADDRDDQECEAIGEPRLYPIE